MYLREKHSGDQLVGRGAELGMKVTRWYQNRAGGAGREAGGDPPGKAEPRREGSLSPDRLPAGRRQPKAEGDSGGTSLELSLWQLTWCHLNSWESPHPPHPLLGLGSRLPSGR